MKRMSVIFFLLSFTLNSAIIYHIPGNFNTIQAAINAAANGDTLLVYPGVYPENIDFEGKKVTVASLFLLTQNEYYISQTILQSGSANPAVTFDSDEDSLAVLIGMTITGGNGGINCDNASPKLKNLIIYNSSSNQHGGGIFCEDAQPILQNIAIYYCSAVNKGGGIYLKNSTPVMQNIFLLSNSAQVKGGGIYLENSNPAINDIQIESCSSVKGGGIYSENSNPIISDLLLFGNSAEEEGGGICAVQGSNLNLTEATFYGNYAGEKGGAIFGDLSTIIVTDAYLDNNSAVEEGGGLYLTDAVGIFNDAVFYHNHANDGGAVFLETSTLQLSACVLTNNFALETGGGLAAEQNSNLVTDYCEFSDNESAVKGGGIFLNDSNGEFHNSVVVNNLAASKGGGIYLDNSPAYFRELRVEENAATSSDGGGIYCDISDAFFENLTMIGNSSGRDGSAIAGFDSDFSIFNGLFHDNYAADDGTIYLANDSQPLLYNLTMVNNAVLDRGGAIYCSSGSPTLINCIVANNQGSYGFYLVSGEPYVIFSNFYNNENGNFRGFSNNIGVNVIVNVNNAPCDLYYNIQLNPLFDSTGEYPFALRDHSPCVNAGSPQVNLLPDFDLIGNPRLYGQYVDMGAYENQNVIIVSAEENSLVQPEIMLSNYPNPFNSSTTISFSFTTEITGLRPDFFGTTPWQAEDTEVLIYNLKGQKVKTLDCCNSFAANARDSRSTYSVIWDGTDDNNQPVSSGIYFYQLNRENSPINKMILFK